MAERSAAGPWSARDDGRVRVVPSQRHPFVAIAVGVGGVAAVWAALSPLPSDATHASPALLLVVPVVVAGLLGGRVAAPVVSGAAGLAYATGFLEPIGSPAVRGGYDIAALCVFLVVANVIGEVAASMVESHQRRAADDADRIALLERVDEQRAALLRSVSHDLRTPLSTIHAVVTDLAAGTAWDDATRAAMLELARDEAERLDRLVANLLSMSRIEAGAFAPNRQALDVADLVATCVARLRRLVRDVPIVVEEPDDLPLVDADATQLDQVLTNLLENAVRHSPPGAAVHIRVDLIDDALRIAVADAGPGIVPDRRELVFEPFGGVEGPGTGGLGLAICRSVVESHGGAVRIGEAPEGGAEIAFTLPLRGPVGASARVSG
jgi:K+-sensing histidine kinase KdpD